MWSLFLLLSKILKMEEERVLGTDEKHSSLIESYTFEHSSSNRKMQDVIFPSSYFVEVPHINQQRYWDCGLACVLMVLRTVGINKYDIQALTELCCTTSTWTVDLAYLLQKFSLNFSYYTITCGANPNYSVETFYKEQLPNDLVRVDMLFREALEAGINIQCRSVSAEEISLLILSEKYIAIALVDQYKLSQQQWMQDVSLSDFYYSTSGYCGHYIVICGYDTSADEFEIRDPASSRKNERISSKCLEDARKSFGTDEDLLLISLENSKKQNSL